MLANMDASWTPAIVGGVFILIIWALSRYSGEWIPKWAVPEAAALCGLSVVLVRLRIVYLDPLLFTLLLYFITHRARVLADVANLVAGWGYPGKALSMQNLALRLAQDAGGRSIVRINMGTALIQNKQPSEAAGVLEQSLAEMPECKGRPKYEAAARYNLGLAYRDLGRESEAQAQFSKAIELAPKSPHGRGAEVAMKNRGRRSS